MVTNAHWVTPFRFPYISGLEHEINKQKCGPTQLLSVVDTRILQIICSGAEIFKRQYDMIVGLMAHLLV